MKKNILLLTFLSISLIAFSQMPAKVKYGLFGGINISEIHVIVPNAGSGWSDSKIGANFGALAEIPVASYFAVQPEITYSSLGWKESQPAYGDSFAISSPKYNLNYLCVPVLLKFKIPQTLRNGNGLAVYVGPQFGYLINANVKEDSGGSLDTKEAFKSSDISGIGGIEYFIPQGIGISVRYQLGFGNIFSNESNQAFNEIFGSNVTVKNNSVTITVGYRF
jgi:hypothetical protein